MEDFKIKSTTLDGVFIIEPKTFFDEQGYFCETYNSRIFQANGLNLRFVQDNEVFSKKDVLRGMHVNIKHPQGKLVRVLYGTILDVLIDLRKISKTYMRCLEIELSKENKKELYIPEGIGHGYLAITETLVQFKTTTHYIPGDEIGFAWNSKAIDINWPIKIPILNERDNNNEDLEVVWRQIS